jgi:gamma-glutamylcyclotransferase (GGCT)/AIG2-like uncharacterized protein YtfP
MPEENLFRLFVYGSLRRGFQNPVYEYISKYFTFTGMGTVQGTLYDMGTYPAGVPDQSERKITGELYHATNTDEFSWAIGQLDDYEGITAEAGDTPLFRRERARVTTDKETTDAWIYWFNGDVKDRPVIDSGDVLTYHQQNK